MSYECGMKIDDAAVRAAVSGWYARRGNDFDSSYVMEHGCAGTLCGWAFSSMGKEIESRALRQMEDDDGEYAVVPLSALSAYAEAYGAFARTAGGKRILACEDVGADWQVGDSTGEAGPDVFISPEDLSEAKRALGSTGKLDGLWELVEDGRAGQLDEFSELVGFIGGLGVSEVGWYLSY